MKQPKKRHTSRKPYNRPSSTKPSNTPTKYTVFDVPGSYVFNNSNGNNNRPTPVGEPTKANLQNGVHDFVDLFISEFAHSAKNEHWVRTHFNDNPKLLSNNLNRLERKHRSLRCSLLWNNKTNNGMVDALLVYWESDMCDVFGYEGYHKYNEMYKIEYLFASPRTRGAGKKLLFTFLEQKSGKFGKNVFLYNSTFNNNLVTNANYKKASFYTKYFNFIRIENERDNVLVYEKGKNLKNLLGAPTNRKSIDFKVR